MLAPHTQYLMYAVGNLSFKCVEGLAPSYLSDRLAERYFVHDRNVRNKNSLNIPAYRSPSG